MERLTLNADVFTALRNDFDKLLARTVGNMMIKHSDTASVTLRLDIDLIRRTMIDESSPDGTREIIMPMFEHRISSVMQVKSEEKGKSDGSYEMAWDELRREYTMRPVINEQMTFD